MAEGEINIDNLIQRLLEGQFWFENQKLVKSYLFLVSTALVKKTLLIMLDDRIICQADKMNFIFTKKVLKLIYLNYFLFFSKKCFSAWKSPG